MVQGSVSMNIYEPARQQSCKPKIKDRRRSRLVSSLAFAATGVVFAAALLMLVSPSSRSAEPSSRVKSVLLQHAVTQKLEQENKCDSACQQKKQMVAAEMKQLREQIKHDYDSMVTFGNKAGYVPPVRSIKEQVMDGSLLGGSDDGPAAPPPFDPKLAAKPGKAFGAANMKKLLASQEPHGQTGASSSASSSILPPVQSPDDVAKKFLQDVPSSKSSDDLTSSVLHPSLSSKISTHDRPSRAHDNQEWEKAFSFIKHHKHSQAKSELRDIAKRGHVDPEPSVVRRAMQKALSFDLHKSRSEVAGDKLLGLHLGHRSSVKHHGDPLGGKFLRDFFGDYKKH
mmetsp:Transcript_22456/g.50600  ORF Transcript_22456/g.50600 Transcript_22456/m.50600 type:complete len:340 (-) Transcript_22456:812-1831(-)